MGGGKAVLRPRPSRPNTGCDFGHEPSPTVSALDMTFVIPDRRTPNLAFQTDGLRALVALQSLVAETRAEMHRMQLRGARRQENADALPTQ